MHALFIGVFAGAYLSDLICYWLGRILGPKLWNIRFFAKMVHKDKVAQISKFYDKYGPLTLVFGRFIPFGVRNGLFLTSGLYDSGYNGVMAGVLHVGVGAARIKKGTRIGQYLNFKAEALSSYDGDYGIGKEHDKKYGS